MIGNWFEAGGNEAEFWRSTPRIVHLFIAAYLRRRGWLAWTTALLPTARPTPSFEQISGTAPAEAKPDKRGMSDEQMLHNLRLFKAALRVKEQRKS